jgi:hypothetical protein
MDSIRATGAKASSKSIPSRCKKPRAKAVQDAEKNHPHKDQVQRLIPITNHRTRRPDGPDVEGVHPTGHQIRVLLKRQSMFQSWIFVDELFLQACRIR